MPSDPRSVAGGDDYVVEDQHDFAIARSQGALRSTQLAEWRRLEAALRESETLLCIVLTSAPIILFAFDRAGVITLAQGRGLATLGRRPSELVGRSVWEWGVENTQLAEALHRALDGDEFTATTKVEGATLDLRYVPLRDRDGQVERVIGVAVDITERVRAEQAVQRLEVGLSRMEWKVLPLLAHEELTYPQIGAMLSISPETVKVHVRRIGEKLGVAGR